MDTILLIAALLPAIALMAYVYSRDKVEKEPAGLVARVFFLGAASGIVAGIAESVLIDVLESVMPEGLLLIVIEYFVCVAAVEEACKFACLNTVKNNPAFDYLFDAVVYSVAAALGFAALENVFYVFDGGLETAAMRAVLSVPGHAADGVVMGVFYGMARQRELRGNKAQAKSYYWLAFLLPTIEHGFYDAALSTESDFLALLAVLFDLAFIVIAFVLVKRTAAKDEPLHPQKGARDAGAAGFGAQPSRGAASNAPVAPLPRSSSTIVSAPPSTQPVAAASPWVCSRCGAQNNGNFCVNCGNPKS